jgi:hypothetical protein
MRRTYPHEIHFLDFTVIGHGVVDLVLHFNYLCLISAHGNPVHNFTNVHGVLLQIQSGY